MERDFLLFKDRISSVEGSYGLNMHSDYVEQHTQEFIVAETNNFAMVYAKIEEEIQKQVNILLAHGLINSSQASLEKGLRDIADKNKLQDLNFFIKYVQNLNSKDTGANGYVALHR